MHVHLLATTALALGLMLPGAVNAQQASDSKQGTQMQSTDKSGTTGQTGAASGGQSGTTTGQSGTTTGQSGTTTGQSGTTTGQSGTTTGQSGTTTGQSGTTSDRTGTTTGQTGATTGQSSTDMGMAWQRDELVGKTLYGANDEELGDVDDVVMGQGGKVQSVLVDVGGFLGMGAKQVAVPVEQIELQGDRLVAQSMTKEQAEQMPEHKQ